MVHKGIIQNYDKMNFTLIYLDICLHNYILSGENCQLIEKKKIKFIGKKKHNLEGQRAQNFVAHISGYVCT